jgi:hypothetical protein
MLANGVNTALTQTLVQRAKAQPDEALVLLGVKAASGLVDVTARDAAEARTKKLPSERVLVNQALLRGFGESRVAFPLLPANEAPAQLLQLQPQAQP